LLFLQSIMIAARPFGLETCPQAAWLIFHEVLQRRLGIPTGQTIVCGMSLGYPDPADTGWSRNRSGEIARASAIEPELLLCPDA
jgi:nitroreductase